MRKNLPWWAVGGILGLLEASILQNPARALTISNDRTLYLLAFITYAAAAWIAGLLLRFVRVTWAPRPGVRKTLIGAATFLLLLSLTYAIVPAYKLTFWKHSPEAKLPNILLITMDTTRADHLGCYGHKVNTSPFLDSLAARGARFENAYTNATWTLPAHASLFSGQMPSVHGAGYSNYLVSNKVRTLAKVLKQQGYTTAAFIGGPFLASAFNLRQGFDYYDEQVDEHGKFSRMVLVRLAAKITGRPFWQIDGQRRADEINRVLFPYVRWASARKPYFLFVNYFDPHEPYDPPEAYRKLLNINTSIKGNIRLFPLNKQNGHPCHKDGSYLGASDYEQLKQLYDGEIRYMDDQISRLWDELNKDRMLDNTLVIILSDHGETIGEHGFLDHGHNLFQEQLRIPLIVLMPGKRPQTILQTAQIVDIFPTVLDYLHLPPAVNIQGRSLMPVLDGKAGADAPVYAELDLDSHPRFKAFRRAQRMILEDWDKYIASSNRNQILYDLKVDPGESVNTLPARPERGAALLKQLEDHFKTLQKIQDKTSTTIDGQTRDQLKALGYIE